MLPEVEQKVGACMTSSVPSGGFEPQPEPS